MKLKLSFFLLCGFILSLCIPVYAQNSQLNEVLGRHVLNFGTQVDYFPFVFYDQNHQISGLDTELLREAAKRMGIELKVYDLAFDGLADSLELGQVDVIGGGFSYTEERAERLDFTRAYYSANGELIVRADSNLVLDTEFKALSGKKIGVMKGSSFENYVHNQFTETSIIDHAAVYTFSKVDDVFAALKNGLVDVIMADEDVFEKQYKTSGFKILKSDAVIENYAFAGIKGTDLIPEINNQLNAMLQDGTAQNIANKFFSLDHPCDESNPIVRPTPNPISTPIPLPPNPNPTPAQCVNGMSFVSDLSIPDNSRMRPGERFTKSWRIYNNGSCAWGSGYELVFVGGEYFNVSSIAINQSVAPGMVYDISAKMTSPNKLGDKLTSFFQMRDPWGRFFGSRIYVQIRVQGDNPQPQPTTPPFIPTIPPLIPTIPPLLPTELPPLLPTFTPEVDFNPILMGVGPVKWK